VLHYSPEVEIVLTRVYPDLPLKNFYEFLLEEIHFLGMHTSYEGHIRVQEKHVVVEL
jgi:hypothetical protein